MTGPAVTVAAHPAKRHGWRAGVPNIIWPSPGPAERSSVCCLFHARSSGIPWRSPLALTRSAGTEWLYIPNIGMTGINGRPQAGAAGQAQGRIRKGAAVLVIAVVAAVALAGFAVILTAVLLVTVGVHQEEKRLTFARRHGPTISARAARLIVGRYVRPTEPEPQTAGRVAVTPEHRARRRRRRRPAGGGAGVDPRGEPSVRRPARATVRARS
jgi:hypothetical protein